MVEESGHVAVRETGKGRETGRVPELRAPPQARGTIACPRNQCVAAATASPAPARAGAGAANMVTVVVLVVCVCE